MLTSGKNADRAGQRIPTTLADNRRITYEIALPAMRG
jgi:hypothetical protein